MATASGPRSRTAFPGKQRFGQPAVCLLNAAFVNDANLSAVFLLQCVTERLDWNRERQVTQLFEGRSSVGQYRFVYAG